MKKSIALTILLAVLMTHISACKTLKSRDQADQLKNAVTYYGAALRWERHDQAFRFHLTQDGKTPTISSDYLKNFSITHFKILSKKLLPISEQNVPQALVHIEVDYFNKTQGKIKKRAFKQNWWYNSEIRGWLIDEDFPKLE